MLDELIGHPSKKEKTQKRKRESGKVEVEKMGTIAVGEVPDSREDIIEEVSRLPTTKLEASILTKEMGATLPTLADIEVAEIALVITLLVCPLIEEEVEVAKLLELELAIIEVAGEEGLVMVGLLVI